MKVTCSELFAKATLFKKKKINKVALAKSSEQVTFTREIKPTRISFPKSTFSTVEVWCISFFRFGMCIFVIDCLANKMAAFSTAHSPNSARSLACKKKERYFVRVHLVRWYAQYVLGHDEPAQVHLVIQLLFTGL